MNNSDKFSYQIPDYAKPETSVYLKNDQLPRKKENKNPQLTNFSNLKNKTEAQILAEIHQKSVEIIQARNEAEDFLRKNRW